MGTVTQKTRIPFAAINDAPVPGGAPPRRFSWGAVFAGAIAGLGVWILLYALGLALGLTVLDTTDPSSIRPSSIFTGWWSVLTPLPALFIGGLVAGRGIGVATRGLGAVHGLVLWGLTTVGGVWLVSNVFTMVVDRAATAGAMVAARDGLASLVPEEARAARDQAAAEIDRATADPESAAIAARDAALSAADEIGAAFFGIFGALVLGLIAAVAGAALGVSRRQVAWAEAPLAVGVAPPMTIPDAAAGANGARAGGEDDPRRTLPGPGGGR